MTDPTFNNLQVRVLALGLAHHPDEHYVYYASTAGPAVACKSLWATLNTEKPNVFCDWAIGSLCGLRPLKTLYQSLPDANIHHMVALHTDPNLLLITDPAGAGVHDETARKQLIVHHMPAFFRSFAAYLNQQTTVPVLDTWAETIWRNCSTDPEAITRLDTYGDCLAAYLIKPDFHWPLLVGKLIQRQELTF